MEPAMVLYSCATSPSSPSSTSSLSSPSSPSSASSPSSPSSTSSPSSPSSPSSWRERCALYLRCPNTPQSSDLPCRRLSKSYGLRWNRQWFYILARAARAAEQREQPEQFFRLARALRALSSLPQYSTEQRFPLSSVIQVIRPPRASLRPPAAPARLGTGAGVAHYAILIA